LIRLLDIVLPVFLVIGLGYGLRLIGFIKADQNAWLSRLVFYVAAPALLFRSLAQEDLAWSLRAPMLAIVGGTTVLVAAGVYLLAQREPPARRGVLAQGALRSNTVFIGLPLVLTAYGDAALAPAAIVIAFMVVAENLLSVLVLTLPHQQHSAGELTLWLRTASKILANPLILGCGGGILWSAFDLPLPVALERALALFGRTAAPLGLLCVGAGLEFGRLRREVPAALGVGTVRLILHPALIYAGLRLLGRTGLELAVPVLIMACPAAVVSYIMAREMGGDASFAAAIIIGTTAASFFTLLAWLALL